ncbi:hypothetical protein NC652_023107 [Populus alba x Populus x berolinensis]|nr:hypothetical protein NC652_023104 [Populus alba x Populus x berolinensis]KAJ6905244.1 hypothetical protein NC652_023107 [Populus alba x Populus x berolinensis]
MEEKVVVEMCSIKELVMIMIYSIKKEIRKKMVKVETCICMKVGKEVLEVKRTCKYTEEMVKKMVEVVTCKHKKKVEGKTMEVVGIHKHKEKVKKGMAEDEAYRYKKKGVMKMVAA